MGSVLSTLNGGVASAKSAVVRQVVRIHVVPRYPAGDRPVNAIAQLGLDGNCLAVRT